MSEKRYMRRYGSFSDGTLLDNVLQKRLSHLEIETLINEQSEDIIRLENKIELLSTENEQLFDAINDIHDYARENNITFILMTIDELLNEGRIRQ